MKGPGHSDPDSSAASLMATFPVTYGVTTVLPAPEGYVVDFENPQRQFDVEHYSIFGVLGSLALLCLVQRIYTKAVLGGGLQTDDALISLAWVASLIMQSVQIWSISIGGLCHHAWEMPISIYEKHMLSSYIVAPIFICCNGLSKTSLLTLYLRISPQKWFKITIWATLVMVASYTITIAGLLLFGCSPIRSAFDPYTPGNCVNLPVLYIAIAVANTVSDVVLFIIPIPTIIKLKMPLAQKIGAGLMFGVGSITVATSIVRMVYLPSLLSSADVPWVAAPANVWSFVEVNLFIICGSMPTLRKFLKRFMPKLMGSSYGSASASNPAPYGDQSQLSRARRQQRTGYSQFDAVELGSVAKTGAETDSEHHGSSHLAVVTAEGGLTKKERDARAANRDDTSEEAILDNKAITYSKTFRIQYDE
ncbi:hypothetical protein F5X68DRAFT_264705 [Plectosphaerella plurivora]|uniref:Rhodopsin domain-containing protein n=1 Tax=Plectosphaerella plurivora TaxID=936078 RepID=A0A9P8V1X6_9PEZI|nr:hypothetical protein F5X68DRAFT_264705 [Plectosphaerella plurivora]